MLLKIFLGWLEKVSQEKVATELQQFLLRSVVIHGFYQVHVMSWLFQLCFFVSLFFLCTTTTNNAGKILEMSSFLTAGRAAPRVAPSFIKKGAKRKGKNQKTTKFEAVWKAIWGGGGKQHQAQCSKCMGKFEGSFPKRTRAACLGWSHWTWPLDVMFMSCSPFLLYSWVEVGRWDPSKELQCQKSLIDSYWRGFLITHYW